MHGQLSDLFIGQARFQWNRFVVFRIIHKALEAAPITRADLDDLAQLVDGAIQISDQAGHQLQCVGGYVIGDQNAVAVVDQTTGWRHRYDRDPIVFSLRMKIVVAINLQI